MTQCKRLKNMRVKNMNAINQTVTHQKMLYKLKQQPMAVELDKSSKKAVNNGFWM